MGVRSQINTLYNQLNMSGSTVRCLVYPHTGGDTETAALAGVALTSGKSYAYGAYVQVVAAAGITVDYHIAGIHLYTNVVADIYRAGIGTGAAASEVHVAGHSLVIDETTAVGEVITQTAYFPVPIRAAANARLAARTAAGSANARAAVVAISCYTNLGS